MTACGGGGLSGEGVKGMCLWDYIGAIGGDYIGVVYNLSFDRILTLVLKKVDFI